MKNFSVMLDTAENTAQHATGIQGKIRESAKNLLEILDKNPELKFIAEKYGICDYGQLRKGLEWLSTQVYCRGGNCRAGDGWTDCPVRKCCIEKGIDFFFQCEEFPCKNFKRA